MAQIDNIAFEVERRQILLKYSTNLADGISTLDWDADPNTVVTGNSAGETLLANVALGANYVESNGNLWFKYALPNSWRQVGGATSVASNVVTKTIAAGATELFYTLDLSNNQNFDFIVDTIHGSDRSLAKVAVLWSDPDVEQNEYSFLGHNIHIDIVVSESGGNCLFNITNDEATSVTASVKVEAFSAL